ncbi:hypothetical protein MF271_16140 [Deinococcus sp. KNUC1210]|uniref:hypothetical protein n=1 Tax=Deinococcus sp. KNUC1210 TaxID=2917691 RepID=UPI001EF11F92|nr:hypothetical protein [Deinococcus sp. KNUC1210]ULH15431.1 hypothetical protein MF271_16140 [Deinococcus sp. KNUC1210]
MQAYARQVQTFQSALDELQVGERRRITLSEQHFQVFLQAWPLLGEARTQALLTLLTAEIRNQNQARGRRSVFSSPEAALNNTEEWLRFLSWATVPSRAPNQAPRAGLRGAAELEAAAPVPMAVRTVLGHAQDLQAAASAAHLAPGMLAAIVDNEQSGQGKLYGLAGVLRTLTDTVALRTSESLGESGLSGNLSQTVGLAQMSWQDALLQKSRFHELGLNLGQPFPENEAEARRALANARAGLLLTASRMVGYLDEQEGKSARPHISAQTYFTGPGWHNNPALLSSGQTWPYAWNGFFKACLYGVLLAD